MNEWRSPGVLVGIAAIVVAVGLFFADKLVPDEALAEGARDALDIAGQAAPWVIAPVLLLVVLFYLHRVYFAKRGWVYEILNLEQTWEIHDNTGDRVTLKKVMDLEFLRDQVTTISDPAWGDGNLFAEYACSPGRYVGTSSSGDRQYAVVMLDPPRRRGDTEHFEMTRVITGGFTRPDEWIEVYSETCTGPFKFSVVFPPDRLPRHCQWSRRKGHTLKNLGSISQRRLEGDRQEYSVRVVHPAPDEVYRLTWTW